MRHGMGIQTENLLRCSGFEWQCNKAPNSAVSAAHWFLSCFWVNVDSIANQQDPIFDSPYSLNLTDKNRGSERARGSQSQRKKFFLHNDE